MTRLHAAARSFNTPERSGSRACWTCPTARLTSGMTRWRESIGGDNRPVNGMQAVTLSGVNSAAGGTSGSQLARLERPFVIEEMRR